MNDDIKEILDKLKSDDYYEKEYQKSVYYERDLKKLEDYITNLQHTEDLYNQLLKDYDELQQAYQGLKDSKEWWNNRFNAVQRDYEDYKSRCEKAVEYINNFSVDKSFSFPLMKRWEENQVKGSIDYEFKTTLYKDLLNILQGGKDE